MRLSKLSLAMVVVMLWGCGGEMQQQEVDGAALGQTESELTNTDPLLGGRWYNQWGEWEVQFNSTGTAYLTASAYQNAPYCWWINETFFSRVYLTRVDTANGNRHYYGQRYLGDCSSKYSKNVELVLFKSSNFRTMEERVDNWSYVDQWQKY